MKIEWTQALIDRLLELHQTKMTFLQIAEMFTAAGYPQTRSAISGKLWRLARKGKVKPRGQTLPERLLDAKAKAARLIRKRERDAARKRRKRATSPQRRLKDMDENERQRLRCEAAEPKHLTIYDLESNTCRYPFGDNPPYTYCGHPTIVDNADRRSSYCIVHHALCFTRGHW